MDKRIVNIYLCFALFSFFLLSSTGYPQEKQSRIDHFTFKTFMYGGYSFEQGIATNNDWYYFRVNSYTEYADVLKITENLSGYEPGKINGISQVNIDHNICSHTSDPFASDTFVFFPCENYPELTKGVCYIYYLSNLTKVYGDDYNGSWSVGNHGLSTGAWWDKYPNNCYFADYSGSSTIYNYTFDLLTGFTFVESHSAGITEVQGMAFGPNSDFLYMDRAHGSDHNIYVMNASSWSTDLGMEDLSYNGVGPYEGMCFDLSEQNDTCWLHISYYDYTCKWRWDIYNPDSNNQPPTAYIDSIDPNPANQGEPVTFIGHGDDPDGTVTGYSWRSSIDGLLSYLPSFTTTGLTPGVHTIYFKVRDNGSKWSSAVNDILEIKVNIPPDQPDINGPTIGRIGISYTYSTSTSDPNGNRVCFWFDWGDGNNSGWIGPVDSGQTVKETYVWRNKGSFSVKVKAKDILDAESVWSDPILVTIPRTRTSVGSCLRRFFDIFPLLQRIPSYIF